jgi:O-phosphoseryl-tRNA(Cys) synthetase
VQAQLAGPAQVKVYKTTVQKNQANLQMYRGSLEGANNSDKDLARDVNLRRTPIVPKSLAIVTAIVAAAAARTLFTRVARIFIVSRVFRGRSDILAIFFLDQLREAEK